MFVREQPRDPHLWEGRNQDWEEGEAEGWCWPARGPSRCHSALRGSCGPLESSWVRLREPHYTPRWPERLKHRLQALTPRARNVKEGAESSRTEKAVWSRPADKWEVTGMGGRPSLLRKSRAAHSWVWGSLRSLPFTLAWSVEINLTLKMK